MTDQPKMIIDAEGGEFWMLDDKLHREDGPAQVLTRGTQMWYIHGKPHRIGGPAIEYSNGNKEWWINGKLHRRDGPAIECANGDKYWYIMNCKVSEDVFNALLENDAIDDFINALEV